MISILDTSLLFAFLNCDYAVKLQRTSQSIKGKERIAGSSYLRYHKPFTVEVLSCSLSHPAIYEVLIALDSFYSSLVGLVCRDILRRGDIFQRECR